ncbi:YopX family protein [Enterococcus sp. 2201sp1_2201st1_B8_2201SCRN_220225]|uniref:YopX family protein n=1 Tax=unclassified Enterococcus TaxID=2608891 RepID=UPI0034A52881
MIKFRYWDGQEKVMKPVDNMSFCDNGEILLHIDCEEWALGPDLILMQSTEFKDNNDTEIFEGDVINIHWFYADFDPVELGAFENEEYAERVIVKKEFGNFGFWWKEADSWVDLATLAMSSRLDEESFEILGNIYETPELLSSGIE